MPRLSPRPALALAAGCALLVSLGVSGCSDDQTGASTPKPTVTTPTETPTLSEKDAAIESAKEAYIKYNDFLNEIFNKGGDLTKVDPLNLYMTGQPLTDIKNAADQYKAAGKTRKGGNNVVGMSATDYAHLTASNEGDRVTLNICVDNSTTHIFVNGVEATRKPSDMGRSRYIAVLQRSTTASSWIVTNDDQVGGIGSC